MAGYAATYARSQADPEGFWAEAAKQTDWYQPARRAFAADSGLQRRMGSRAFVHLLWPAAAWRGDRGLRVSVVRVFRDAWVV